MRKTVKLFNAILLLVALGASLGWAQTGQALTGDSGNSAINDGRYAELRAKGFDALYNLDYAEARRQFKEMQRLYPDHPAGWQFQAATVWLETMNRSRRLQTSLYNNDSFYAETEEKTDPQTVREFRELTKQASALAEARLKRKPDDTEALYFLGAIAGLKAAFAGAVERRFVAALREGDASVDRHRQVLKLDPGYRDAEVTIGLYDYVVGDLPLAVKIVASLGGFRGSKKRGLATLERVVREAKWANDDARVMLIALYRRENRPADAARLARELAARYERNYLFKLELADALVAEAAQGCAAGNTDTARRAESEAFTIFETLLADSKPREDKTNRSLDLVRFKYAEALQAGGQAERAAGEFLRAAADTNAEATLATMARLRAAQAFDLAGKRAEAIAQYKTVLARPKVYDAHEQAERGVRQPYGAQRGEKTDVKNQDEKRAGNDD